MGVDTAQPRDLQQKGRLVTFDRGIAEVLPEGVPASDLLLLLS
jgi:hypothetical protein